MTDWLVEESRLVETADRLALRPADLDEAIGLLEGWRASLTQALDAHRLECPQSLRSTHPLARQVRGLDALLTTCIDAGTRQWAQREPAHRLARSFEDRAMLLIFGKFNAGKSSLCNLLAERFSAHGKEVRRFWVEAGRLVPTVHAFPEGATETTACMQGVCLGEHLVLLDTPGLHSLTAENASLTQRFTDSADGVLWLTSSTAPGQVRELDELARELRRGKPLLPVITRSDVIEEDEVEGEIVRLARNKTPADRLLQEDDVRLRARDRLLRMGISDSVLRAPVSVSAHVARAGGQTAQALRESGFGSLYAALLDLVEPARIYKRRKPAEMLLHHLEENVLGALASDLEPALSGLLDQIARERARMREIEPRVATRAWREAASGLPRLLERRPPPADAGALEQALAESLAKAVSRQASAALGDYAAHRPRPDTDLRAVLADRAFAGADHERLHGALLAAIHRQAFQRFGAVFDRCHQALDTLAASVDALRSLLGRQGDDLHRIRQRLRAADPEARAAASLPEAAARARFRDARADPATSTPES